MEEEVEKGTGKVDCGKDIVHTESDSWQQAKNDAFI